MWLCFLKQYKEKYTLKKINKYLNEREIVYWDYLIKYLKQNRKKKIDYLLVLKKLEAQNYTLTLTRLIINKIEKLRDGVIKKKKKKLKEKRNFGLNI